MKKYLFVMFYSAIVLILFISYLPNSDLVNAYAYTLYVKDDAAGNNDGSSWINAYTSLQTALENVSGGDEVWVAKGTYKPNYKTEPDDLRTSTFQLKNGVVIYGGFNGTESNIFERDWKANQTILSGNIGTNDEIADNCYHVVTGSNTDSTAVIDGFIITGGNADFTNGQGGGVFILNGSPIINNCTFSYNYAKFGGGMANINGSPALDNCTFNYNRARLGGGMADIYGSPTLTNCTFNANSADEEGGGIYNDSNNPRILNSTFSYNSANNGGGIYSYWYGNLAVTNCTFSGNTADSSGGGIYVNWYSSSRVINCTIVENAADNNNDGEGKGGGLYISEGSILTIKNTIIANNQKNSISDDCFNNNSTINSSGYNLAEYGCASDFNKTGDITDEQTKLNVGELTDNGGYTQTCALETESIAIDMGTDSGAPVTDQRGYGYERNGTTDIGAFEYSATPTVPVVVSVGMLSVGTDMASIGGYVTLDGGTSVTSRGVCWDTTPNPTIENSHTTDGAGTGIFTSSITGLTPNTAYYVRVYATNSVGTSYGKENSFTTDVATPTVTTAAISSVTATTAFGGGNVTSNGGASITARGVCWNTGQNPTIEDSHTTDGAGIGVFTSFITELTPGATYYVRAYVANSEGTSYGEIASFTTNIITTPPTVISTSPAENSTGVNTDTDITAIFSEAMNSSTITTSTFSVNDGSGNIAGTVTYSGTTATFTPSSVLSENKTYTATVTTGVKDLEGSSMQSDHMWSFTTAGTITMPPTVDSVSPANNTLNVPINSVITATFSEALDASSVTTSSFLVKDGSVTIAGTVTYSGTTATFTPSSALDNDKNYIATVTTGVKDLEGTPMVSDYNWSFTTVPSSGFFVESTVPANDALGVNWNTDIVASFSKEIDPSSVNNNTFYVMQITGTVSSSAATATFAPNSALEPDKTYTATITTGAKDLDGNHLQANYSWSFTTKESGGPNPFVNSTDPADKDVDVDVNTKITATFSETMNSSTITGDTFYVGTMSGSTLTLISGAVSYSGTTATFTPASSLDYSTTYTAGVTTDAKDVDGNPLLSEFKWSFSTNTGGNVSLVDAILVLKVVAGMNVINNIYQIGDVNGNGKIGIEEAIYILQFVATLRN